MPEPMTPERALHQRWCDHMCATTPSAICEAAIQELGAALAAAAEQARKECVNWHADPITMAVHIGHAEARGREEGEAAMRERMECGHPRACMSPISSVVGSVCVECISRKEHIRARLAELNGGGDPEDQP